MREVTMGCDYAGLESEVLPRLRGRVFHVTNEVGYAGIRESGEIRMRGTKPVMATMTEVSFGRAHDYVCLMDLRTATDQVIEKTLREYYYFLDPLESTESVFLIVDSSAYDVLIPNDEGVGRGQAVVPEVEVWYPGDLPLTAIETVIHVPIARRDPFEANIDKEAFAREFPPDAPVPLRGGRKKGTS